MWCCQVLIEIPDEYDVFPISLELLNKRLKVMDERLSRVVDVRLAWCSFHNELCRLLGGHSVSAIDSVCGNLIRGDNPEFFVRGSLEAY